MSVSADSYYRGPFTGNPGWDPAMTAGTVPGKWLQFAGFETALWRSAKSALWGVGIGSTVDNMIPQSINEEGNIWVKLGLIVFSASACGFATHVLRNFIDEEDAVQSGLFFTTLMSSQPKLMKRVAEVSETVGDMDLAAVNGFSTVKKSIKGYLTNIPSASNTKEEDSPKFWWSSFMTPEA